MRKKSLSYYLIGVFFTSAIFLPQLFFKPPLWVPIGFTLLDIIWLLLPLIRRQVDYSKMMHRHRERLRK